MNHILILGRRGRSLNLGLLIQQFQVLEEFHNVVTGNTPIPTTYAEIKEIQEKLTRAEKSQPECFFVMPQPQRINEHPNDDWRGRGNRKKRIKRNDR
jgi:hypothetical protein